MKNIYRLCSLHVAFLQTTKRAWIVVVIVLTQAFVYNADCQVPKKSTGSEHQFTFKIINSEQNTYGYDILNKKRPFIHQPNIPGLTGNKGFATKYDAAAVAKLVISKLNRNIMPPSVTKQELKNLNVKI